MEYGDNGGKGARVREREKTDNQNLERGERDTIFAQILNIN